MQRRDDVGLLQLPPWGHAGDAESVWRFSCAPDERCSVRLLDEYYSGWRVGDGARCELGMHLFVLGSDFYGVCAEVRMISIAIT